MKLPLSEAAKHVGVHPDTLRDWGRQDPPKGPRFTRTAGGHRRYDTDELTRWQLDMAKLQHRINRAHEDVILAGHGIVRQTFASGKQPTLPTLEAKAEAEAGIRADLGHIL